jgi:hypothetical protein
MSLEKWVEYGWLRQQATSPDEIQGLLSIVDRGLKDAQVAQISSDLRITAAFSSALQCCTAALRACGYRPSGPGHHMRVIESLEHTMGAPTRAVHRLLALSRKRNISNYDFAGAVSEQDLAYTIKLATELRAQVIEWLKKNHPELLK